MFATSAAVTGTSVDPRSDDETAGHHGAPSGLARKLTCTVVSVRQEQGVRVRFVSS